MSYLSTVTDHFIGFAMSFVSFPKSATFTIVSTVCTFPKFFLTRSWPWFRSFIVISQVHSIVFTIVRCINYFDSRMNCKRVIDMVRSVKFDNSMIKDFGVIKCCCYS